MGQRVVRIQRQEIGGEGHTGAPKAAGEHQLELHKFDGKGPKGPKGP